jgi:hypothetical protein
MKTPNQETLKKLREFARGEVRRMNAEERASLERETSAKSIASRKKGAAAPKSVPKDFEHKTPVKK